MQKHNWSRLRERLSRADFEKGKVLLGLDFDGTLADIVDKPQKAILSAETRRLLLLLSRRADTKVAVLSGRALADVKSLAGLPGVYYAGSHGLEIQGPGIRWRHSRAQGVGRALLGSLERHLREFPGTFIERKPLGLTVHYRGVPRRHLRRLRQRVVKKLSGLEGRFRLLRGKKTFDLRPSVSWDKGNAFDSIRRTLSGGWTAVFVGDDATDEEAFRTIGPRALTVRVGRTQASAADYVISRRRLVDRLLEILAGRSGSR